MFDSAATATAAAAAATAEAVATATATAVGNVLEIPAERGKHDWTDWSLFNQSKNANQNVASSPHQRFG